VQNIKDWPLFIKICFGIIIITLTVAGVVEIPKLSEKQTSGKESSQKGAADSVKIGIIIESANTAKVLENVEVRFVSKGSPETRMTDTQGFAQIEIPSREDIEITLSKKGFKTAKFTTNLNNDSQKTRTYRLESQ
jgi:hypothetical protein